MPPEPPTFDTDPGPTEPGPGDPESPGQTTIESVVIACPRCGVKGGHPVESLGRRVECGGCGHTFLTSKFILAYCKTCDKNLKVRPVNEGRDVRCTHCNGRFRLRIPQGKARGLPSSKELRPGGDPAVRPEPGGRPREDDGGLRHELEAARTECERLRAEADRLRAGLLQAAGSSFGVDLMGEGHPGLVEASRVGAWDNSGASATSVRVRDPSAPGRREPRPDGDRERDDLERQLAEQASRFETERRAWREQFDAAERRPADEPDEAAGQLSELRAELDHLRQAREADRRRHQRELDAAQRELEAARSEVEAGPGRVAEAMRAAGVVERRLAETRAQLRAEILRADHLEAELRARADAGPTDPAGDAPPGVGPDARVGELTGELRRAHDANNRLRSLLNVFGFSERD